MLFNSFAFAVFLPIVFILFWILPQKYRWTVLLLSSYYYYMSWNVNYVVLLLLTTGISYGCARLLERTEEKRKKKAICGVAVLAALLLLFFFKYFNFVNGAVAELLQRMALDVHPMTLKLMLPIGISFYTFKTVAYVIDVYR
ncbi:MAG: MBOAT family protein, partial [Anaerovoracaceae bacterium]